MIHFIVDKLDRSIKPGMQLVRVSACGSYVGGTSGRRKNVTCPECLAKAVKDDRQRPFGIETTTGNL